MAVIPVRLKAAREIGLAIGERAVAFCEVVATPLGHVEVARQSVEFGPDGLAEAIETLLASRLTPEERGRARVQLGLPTLRVFFSTRPIQATQLEASPLVLLHEVIQSPTVNIDEMLADLVKIHPGRRTLASIVACRKKYLAGVLAALEAAGLSPTRAEPFPSALLRHAAIKARVPRKARVYVRVFLGAEEGLVVLATGADLPVMWRPFNLPRGEEAVAVLAAIASVRILGGYCGLPSDIDAALIHGRPDLGPLDEIAGSPAMAGVRIIRHDRPALDLGDVAFGLAIGPPTGSALFNLVRSLVGRPKFRDIFPRSLAMVQAILLVSAGLMLQHRLGVLRVGREAVRVQNAKYAWAGKLSDEKLKANRKDLDARVEAVRTFVDSRVAWTALIGDIAGRLPGDLALASLQGHFELGSSGGGRVDKAKRSLSLQLRAPIPKTGAIPREIDAFLRDLRDSAPIKASFPEIDLSDLRWMQDTGKTASARFTVICGPAKNADPVAKGKAANTKGTR